MSVYVDVWLSLARYMSEYDPASALRLPPFRFG
jgi:hypothetical protein